MKKAPNFHIQLETAEEIHRRWHSTFPKASFPLQIQQISRDEFVVDYSKMEPKLIMACFPGEDGIGADVFHYDPSFAPQLEDPYAKVAADILKNDDVIYEQLDPYMGGRRLKAKVLRFDPVKDSAEIEFEDKKLIPPTMWVPTHSLRQAWGGRVINTQTHCPKCEVPWKETMLARFSVFDCPSCGAKKEDHAR